MMTAMQHIIFRPEFENEMLQEEFDLVSNLLSIAPDDQISSLQIILKNLWIKLNIKAAATKDEIKNLPSPQQAIQEIEQEINIFPEYYHLFGVEIKSPRYIFLKKKHRALLDYQENLNYLMQKESEKETSSSLLRKLFDIGKKIVDMTDDAWTAIGRAALPQRIVDFVGPILTGSVGSILHLVEGIFGFKKAVNAYKNKNTELRKTKLAVGLTTGIIGGSGLGMGIAYVASGIGASFAGSTLMPVLVPGLLTAIYSLALGEKSYQLYKLKQKEKIFKNSLTRAYKALKNEEANYKKIILRLTNINNDLHQRNNDILAKMAENTHTAEEKNELQVNYRNIARAYSIIIKTESDFANKLNTFNEKKEAYKQVRAKKINAEREVALTAVEVAASATVVTGILLGTIALIGAGTVASLGLLPIGLIIAGVATGLAIKIFEKLDEKNDNKFSMGIRNFFASGLKKISSCFTKKENPTLESNSEASSRLSSGNIIKGLANNPAKSAPATAPFVANFNQSTSDGLSIFAAPAKAMTTETREDFSIAPRLSSRP